MKKTIKPNGETVILLDRDDTYDWAHRPGAGWPGSTLSGKSIRAEFAKNGDLVDLYVFAKGVAVDDSHYAANELAAILADAQEGKIV